MTSEFILKHQKNIWTNVYGLARSILAFGTILTLLFNNNITLFYNILPGSENQMYLSPFIKYSFFILLNNHILFAKIIAILILLIVISGWKPRYTCILHWYIAFSFFISCSVVDGGDQVGTVLTFLLIPIAFTDKRNNHWGRPLFSELTDSRKTLLKKILANSSAVMIRIQVAIIYLNASVEKFKVPEWKNGTILWYWFQDPVYGANSSFLPFIKSLLDVPIILIISTWAVIFTEFLLFLGLVIDPKYRKHLLVLGIAFHFAIILIHGLGTFFLSMVSALILYLLPLEITFNFKTKKNRIRPGNTEHLLNQAVKKSEIFYNSESSAL